MTMNGLIALTCSHSSPREFPRPKFCRMKNKNRFYFIRERGSNPTFIYVYNTNQCDQVILSPPLEDSLTILLHLLSGAPQTFHKLFLPVPK